ncbi:MAG: hypothetical protein R3250_02275 [Melioribacteraceae bacterium]|nr:hypothetical protein [Melioribacteraceae bacterium]
MREYFSEQLDENPAVITEEKLSTLLPGALYSDYEIGDLYLTFYQTSIVEGETQYVLYGTVERELDQVDEDYEFLEYKDVIPVLVRKES